MMMMKGKKGWKKREGGRGKDEFSIKERREEVIRSRRLKPNVPHQDTKNTKEKKIGLVDGSVTSFASRKEAKRG